MSLVPKKPKKQHHTNHTTSRKIKTWSRNQHHSPLKKPNWAQFEQEPQNKDTAHIIEWMPYQRNKLYLMFQQKVASFSSGFFVFRALSTHKGKRKENKERIEGVTRRRRRRRRRKGWGVIIIRAWPLLPHKCCWWKSDSSWICGFAVSADTVAFAERTVPKM